MSVLISWSLLLIDWVSKKRQICCVCRVFVLILSNSHIWITGGALQRQRGEDCGQPQCSLRQVQGQARQHQRTRSGPPANIEFDLAFFWWSCITVAKIIVSYFQFCPKLFFYKHMTILFTDFSDRISRSRRVGYESGDFEIVSTLILSFLSAFKNLRFHLSDGLLSVA